MGTPVWWKLINTSIHVSLCALGVSVTLWYAIFHWLSIRCVSSYKMVILSHILHSLSRLAYCILYFVKQICYFPSLPPFGGVVIVTLKLINVVHLSYLAIRSVKSHRDFPQTLLFRTSSIALFTVTAFFICMTMYLNVDVRQFRAKSAKLPEIASHPRSNTLSRK